MTHNIGTYEAMDRIRKLRRHHTYKSVTWLQDEDAAYPNGGQTRMGRAIDFATGAPIRVWVGIADTMWTAPAHTKRRGRYVAGFIYINDTLGEPLNGALIFRRKVK